MKRVTKEFLLMWGILTVVVTFLTSFSIAFFSSVNNVGGTITLGELDFQIVDESTIPTSNVILPGDVIEHSVKVVNSRDVNGTNFQNLSGILIRVTPNFFVNDELDDLFTSQVNTDDWVVNENIYYYKKAIMPSEEANILSGIKTSVNLDNSYQDKNLIVELIVEAIQYENQAYVELWADAPQEWVDAIVG